MVLSPSMKLEEKLLEPETDLGQSFFRRYKSVLKKLGSSTFLRKLCSRGRWIFSRKRFLIVEAINKPMTRKHIKSKIRDAEVARAFYLASLSSYAMYEVSQNMILSCINVFLLLSSQSSDSQRGLFICHSLCVGYTKSKKDFDGNKLRKMLKHHKIHQSFMWAMWHFLLISEAWIMLLGRFVLSLRFSWVWSACGENGMPIAGEEPLIDNFVFTLFALSVLYFLPLSFTLCRVVGRKSILPVVFPL